MNFSDIVLTLLLMAVPTGSIPMVLFLVKDLDKRRARWILFRETLISLLLGYLFLFAGKSFLTAAQIETYTVTLGGGILIFLIALRMVFPKPKEIKPTTHHEPFVFPIATPIISGGGVLVSIIVCAQQASYWNISLSMLLVWTIVLAVMMSLPYLQKLIGSKGLIVVENFMGMILLMRSCALLQNGVSLFLKEV
jgi:multiple antibiotic resistance protein